MFLNGLEGLRHNATKKEKVLRDPLASRFFEGLKISGFCFQVTNQNRGGKKPLSPVADTVICYSRNLAHCSKYVAQLVCSVVEPEPLRGYWS